MAKIATIASGFFMPVNLHGFCCVLVMAWLFGQLNGWPHHVAVLQTHLITSPDSLQYRQRLIPIHGAIAMSEKTDNTESYSNIGFNEFDLTYYFVKIKRLMPEGYYLDGVSVSPNFRTAAEAKEYLESCGIEDAKAVGATWFCSSLQEHKEIEHSVFILVNQAFEARKHKFNFVATSS